MMMIELSPVSMMDFLTQRTVALASAREDTEGHLPDDCGQDLRAQDDWQPMSEHGKTIEVEIDSITDDLKTYGCGYAAVEIKSQDDQRLTGYRFCSKDDQGIRLTSNHTPVPIITYSMTTAPLHVTLKYRSVPTKG
ncbi:hypothetical protein ANCCEY_01617 [Ancylostoma ceylanicum]|uniref:CUB domain-containing protein n=1 Tax=Ancylostoma ceylanicum TaxID=53326 RepID=A0A0D6M5C5_9BILA|nr:hypothetical protein ANCCEY_01617 [Ancylostoma ceylanicum]